MSLDTPTDRRKRKTHTAVLDAAEEVFRRDGYRGSTIETLAKEADVAVSSIYANFVGGKADVYASLAWRIARLHEQDMPTSGPVIDSLDRYIAFHNEHPLALRLLSLHDVETTESELVRDAKTRIDSLLSGIVDALASRAKEVERDVDARALVLHTWASVNGAVSLFQRGMVDRRTLDTMLDITRTDLLSHLETR